MAAASQISIKHFGSVFNYYSLGEKKVLILSVTDLSLNSIIWLQEVLTSRLYSDCLQKLFSERE